MLRNSNDPLPSEVVLATTRSCERSKTTSTRSVAWAVGARIIPRRIKEPGACGGCASARLNPRMAKENIAPWVYTRTVKRLSNRARTFEQYPKRAGCIDHVKPNPFDLRTADMPHHTAQQRRKLRGQQ